MKLGFPSERREFSVLCVFPFQTMRFTHAFFRGHHLNFRAENEHRKIEIVTGYYRIIGICLTKSTFDENDAQMWLRFLYGRFLVTIQVSFKNYGIYKVDRACAGAPELAHFSSIRHDRVAVPSFFQQ